VVLFHAVVRSVRVGGGRPAVAGKRCPGHRALCLADGDFVRQALNQGLKSA
jgi:hypothetical protein